MAFSLHTPASSGAQPVHPGPWPLTTPPPSSRGSLIPSWPLPALPFTEASVQSLFWGLLWCLPAATPCSAQAPHLRGSKAGGPGHTCALEPASPARPWSCQWPLWPASACQAPRLTARAHQGPCSLHSTQEDWSSHLQMLPNCQVQHHSLL